MVKFLAMAFVASALTLVAADSVKLGLDAEITLAPLVEPAHEPLQVATSVVLEKRDVLDIPSTIISQILPVRERTAPVTSPARFSFKRIRVQAYLANTLNAILPHTTTIRKLCAGAENADADKLSWALVTELKAILKILNECLYKVKDCGNAPTPSGIPGAKCPTLDDICQLFFKIMCEIRECCKLIGSLCIKYKAVRRVCQDTLKEITGCLSSIAIRCGVEVGDMSSGLGRLFATIPHFFTNVQFGFNAFPSLLGGGYGSFSVDASLM